MQEITDKQQFLEFTTSPEGKYTKLVHFWADWSPACSELDKLLDELKDGEWGNEFEAAKIGAENLPDISLEFDIKAVPTILAFQNGKMVEKLEGFVPIKLKELVVKSHFDGTAAKSKNMEQNNEAIDDGTPELKENLNDRLKRLINRARLTLFMKGSPDMPKCGFSRQIVELLRQNDIEFWTFDILCDEVVRQGLKEYSDWPTYPQLYLDGELLGGLDVIREEMKDPNFVEKLPKLSNRK